MYDKTERYISSNYFNNLVSQSLFDPVGRNSMTVQEHVNIKD